MHLTASAAVFLAFIQPPLCFLAMNLEKHLYSNKIDMRMQWISRQSYYADILPKNVTYASVCENAIETLNKSLTQLEVKVSRDKWDGHIATLSVLCSVYALLNIIVNKYNDAQKEAMEELEYEEVHLYEFHVRIKRVIHCMHVVFWGMIFVKSKLLWIILTSHGRLQSESLLWNMALQRTISLWGLTNTEKYTKRDPWHVIVWVSLYLYVHMVYIFNLTDYYTNKIEPDRGYWTSPKLFFLFIQSMLDIILFIGHIGDFNTTFMVVFNCRIFYASLSTFAIQWYVLAGIKMNKIEVCSKPSIASIFTFLDT